MVTQEVIIYLKVEGLHSSFPKSEREMALLSTVSMGASTISSLISKQNNFNFISERDLNLLGWDFQHFSHLKQKQVKVWNEPLLQLQVGETTQRIGKIPPCWWRPRIGRPGPKWIVEERWMDRRVHTWMQHHRPP